MATIYMAVMGKNGLINAANQSISKAQYAVKAFRKAGIKPCFDGPFFNEFVVDLGADTTVIYETLAKQNILCGLPLKDHGKSVGLSHPEHKLLICVTEKRTKAEIDSLVQAIVKAVK